MLLKHLQIYNMNEKQLEIQQQQHAEIIRQMRIDTAFNAVMATASLLTMITIFLRLQKHITA